MKISLNLIKKFTDITLDESELLERIASRIGEIDSLERLGSRYEGIVVGSIEEAGDHPDADKLGVYQVNIGKQKTIQVVAGDKSLKVGDKVAYIPPGNTVPSSLGDTSPTMIEERDLRGQKSSGMLASINELALGDDHEGVLVLDTDAEPGADFSPLYELDDTIVEIENKALTHRPDCFGHIGFAREISGIQATAFSSPDWFLQTQSSLNATDKTLKLSGINEVPDLCNRLTLAGYSISAGSQSPFLLRTYLQRLGLRPLNPVVDITNYMMLVTGQPLHAFDYDKLAERSEDEDNVAIHARQAHAGETLKLLNGQTVKLDTSDIVIATDKTAVALAGVMGGADTEVDENTSQVVIEAANFNMYAIRNTSMRHGLFTEAVTRFSRGQDPAMCSVVQARTADLLKEHCSAELAASLVDIFDNPRQAVGIVVDAQRINRILGSDYDIKTMADTLNNVEVATVINKDNLDITPPSWRPDLNIPEDIVEEVGRLQGYGSLPVTIPAKPIVPEPVSDIETLRRSAVSFLRSAGGHEVLSYSGVSAQLLAKAGQSQEHAFTIKNALSPALEHMRISISPSLLDVVYANLRRGYDQFALFEFSTTHHKGLMEEELPQEQPSVAVVLAATKKSPLGQGQTGAGYYHAAHWLKQLLSRLGLTGLELEGLESGMSELKVDDSWLESVSSPFEPKRSAIIRAGGLVLGVVGEYRPAVRNGFKLPAIAAGFELHCQRLLEAASNLEPVKYEPLSRFPKVENDVTLKVPADQTFAAVEMALSEGLTQSEQVHKIKPVDIYQADDASERNISFRVWSWRTDRTLKADEVNQAIDAAVAHTDQICNTTRV